MTFYLFSSRAQVSPLGFSLVIAAALVTGGCASKNKNVPTQIGSVQRVSKIQMDPEISRSSEALHSFLVGELAYGKDHYKEALKQFSKASELSPDAQPVVSSKLAALYLREGNMQRAYEEGKRARELSPDDIEIALLYGGIIEAQGKLDEAEDVYEEILKKDPTRIEPYALLASIYRKNGKTAELPPLLKRFHEVAGNNPGSLRLLAKVYEDQGDLAQAKRYARRAYEGFNPSSVGAGDLIRVLLKLKDREGVKEICREVLEKEPSNVPFRKLLGHLLLGEEAYDEALSQLKMIEEVDADSTDIHLSIALIHIEKQNYDEAAKELSLLLAKQPDLPEARYYLGSVDAAKGDVNAALQELFKIKEGQKMFVESRTLAAFLLRESGQNERAAAVAKEGLATAPSSPQLLEYLAGALKELGRFDEVAVLYGEQLKKNPGNEPLMFSYGIALQGAGRVSESEEMMRRVIEVNPDNEEALNFLAYSYAEQSKELDKAQEMVERALKKDPKNGYFLDTLGWVQFQKGDFDAAVSSLKKACELVPGDLVLRLHLVEAYVRAQKIDDAFKVLSLDVDNERVMKESDQKAALKALQRKKDLLSAKYPELTKGKK